MQLANDNQVMDAIQRVLLATLEDFAFIFAEPCETPNAASALATDKALCASVAFKGDSQAGEVQVVMALPPCREMAANVMGIDEDEVNDTIADDAIREWANIVTGALVVELYGVETVFTLSAPQAREMTSSEVAQFIAQEGAVTLTVDDHPVIGMLLKV